MKVIGNQLAILVERNAKKWADNISELVAAYRALPHPATGETPFFLLHGFDPAWPVDVAMTSNKADDFKVGHFDYGAHIKELQDARIEAARRLKEVFQHRLRNNSAESVPKCEEGQIVWKKEVRRLNKFGGVPKLSDKWLGPYRVIRCYDNELTYELRSLLDGSVIKAHITLIKPFVAMRHKELISLCNRLPSVQKFSVRQ
eukprot:GHVQ01039118.1.p1 GENE.GHVQ01039118.1~~GHVQ01039118.1.p1  ORF type:complete len:201 (+),score=17.48 GHVQ01039118.1:496-1098(+)